MACSQNPASESVADFIYHFYTFSPDMLLSENDICYDFVSNRFIIVYQPLADALPLSVAENGYDTLPNLYTLLDSTNMDSAGILQTFEQPRLGFRGRGTIVGIVDTGIDYQNPVFRNRDGTTKVLGIWDQTIEGNGLQTNTAFGDLSYGTVFTEEQINEALRSDDPLAIVPSTDTNGHGTFMASIAAGNDTAVPGFTGAAPEARLVIVKLKPAKKYLRDFYFVPQEADAYQENDIMLGVKYLLLSAIANTLPISILLGLGTNMGSHSGTSPLARYLSNMTNTPGQIMTLAGGNETGFGHHFLGAISAEEEFEDVELRVGPSEPGFTLELWARESELYTVGFISPSGEEIRRIPISTSGEQRITFLLEDTVIYLTYTGSETTTGSQLIFMRFQAPASGIWRIRVYNALFINGQYHIWLPARGFISDSTFFLRSNPDTTIMDPGNSPALITAAAYNHRNNSIYIHSSRGYTRIGAIKPDLAAPGVNVAGPGGQTATGTSVAAAHVAGAAANLLAWAITGQNNLLINTPIAKAILIRGANRRSNLSYPNREWGYGTLDLYNSFLIMRE